MKYACQWIALVIFGSSVAFQTYSTARKGGGLEFAIFVALEVAIAACYMKAGLWSEILP